jgi:hypothetical protein
LKRSFHCSLCHGKPLFIMKHAKGNEKLKSYPANSIIASQLLDTHVVVFLLAPSNAWSPRLLDSTKITYRHQRSVDYGWAVIKIGKIETIMRV